MANQHCLTQFDLMMQLAQKRDSAAQIFDAQPKNMPRVPLNNFLYDQVTINVEESDVNIPAASASKPPIRSSVTE